MSLGASIYNALFRRSSTAAITIAASAYVIERVIDESCRVIWVNSNKGLLWDDIKHKYEQ